MRVVMEWRLNSVTKLQCLRLVLNVIYLHLSDDVAGHFLIDLLIEYHGLLLDHFVTITILFERFLSVIHNPIQWAKILNLFVIVCDAA